MKKTLLIISTLGLTFASAQEIGYGKSVVASSHSSQLTHKNISKMDCGALVSDSDEMGGVFIVGDKGQGGAVDIPMQTNQKVTITGIKVSLASVDVPTFVHFVFYNNTQIPADEWNPEPVNIPNEEILQVNTATIDSYEEIGFDIAQGFTVRNVTLKLAEPIVLDASMSDGPIWMSVKSDANAWATAFFNDGQGAVGDYLALSYKEEWSQLDKVEGMYELTADCEFLAASETEASAKVNISPNPAQDYFEYKNLNSLKIISTEIYDAAGNLVKSVKGQSKIKIADLKSGVYFIKSKTSSHVTLSNKLIKN